MRPVSVHRTFPVEVRFEATNGSIPLLPPRTNTSDGQIDVRRMAVVPLHALISNKSCSELDTERYVCVVEGWPVCLRHRSCEGYKAQPGQRPSIGREEVVEVAV